MSNLGGYQKLTTFAKRVGGPGNLVVLIAGSGVAVGAIAVKAGELAVKKGKQAITKRKERKNDLLIRFFCKCWGRRKQRSFGKNQMRTAF